jgi:heptosyltransferase-1
MKKCSLVIGVDSGLPHLAAALGLPTLGLYGSTNPELTGTLGRRAHNLKAEFGCSPCLRRQCAYKGQPVTWNGQPVIPPCFASLPPQEVWRQAKRLNHASSVLHL